MLIAAVIKTDSSSLPGPQAAAQRWSGRQHWRSCRWSQRIDWQPQRVFCHHRRSRSWGQCPGAAGTSTRSCFQCCHCCGCRRWWPSVPVTQTQSGAVSAQTQPKTLQGVIDTEIHEDKTDSIPREEGEVIIPDDIQMHPRSPCSQPPVQYAKRMSGAQTMVETPPGSASPAAQPGQSPLPLLMCHPDSQVGGLHANLPLSGGCTCPSFNLSQACIYSKERVGQGRASPQGFHRNTCKMQGREELTAEELGSTSALWWMQETCRPGLELLLRAPALPVPHPSQFHPFEIGFLHLEIRMEGSSVSFCGQIIFIFIAKSCSIV